MAKKEKPEILMTADGRFYFGRQKKDGSLTADSVEISEDIIFKLIAAFFENYCSREGTDTLMIQNPQGVVVMKQVLFKDMQEAIAKKAGAPTAAMKVKAGKSPGVLARKRKAARKRTSMTQDN